MPTVIDSLLVRLGIDKKPFDKDKKNVDKDIKDLSKKGKKEFDSLAASAGKFLAVLGGSYAIKRFVQDQIEANSYLQRFSKNLGESVDKISAFSNAAELSGGSASGLQGTLSMLSRAQTELMLTGQSGLVPYLSALGVSLTDIHGKAIPVTEELINIGQALLSKTGDRKTAFNMGQMMGIDPGTLNMILRSRKEAEELLKLADKYKLTQKQADEEEHLRQKTAELSLSFTAFGYKLMEDVFPALDKLLNLFLRFGDWCKENGAFIKNFLISLVVILGAFAIATAPITLMTLAIIQLAAGVALLWTNFEGAVQACKDLATALPKGIKKFLGIEETKKSSSQTGSSDKDAMSFFQKKGWTKEQAAGLVANLKKESGLNPSAVGDSGKAYGIGQWHSDRQTEFQKLFGHSIFGSSIDEQLAFMQYELTQGNERGAGNRLRATTSANEAGAVVSRYYERPANVLSEMAARGDLANSLMRGSTTSTSKTVQIGEVNVVTQATDANGIAKDIGKSLDYLLASQVNYGLT